jgi:hypothetical protein
VSSLWLYAAFSGCFSSSPLARDGLASGHSAAGEPAQKLFGVKAESVEQVGVLVGVDLVGELLGGLVRALVVAALAQKVQDHVLVELHAVSLWLVAG